MSRILTSAVLLGLTLVSANGATLPASAAANAGTLTCSLSPSQVDPPEPATANVSCTFKPVLGVDARFDGVVKRFGVTDERDAKIVLVWSVVAPEAKIGAENLEGEYVGSITKPGDVTSPGSPGPPDPLDPLDRPETTLIGGKDNAVQLRPLTPDPNISTGSGVSVLELKIAKIRT